MPTLHSLGCLLAACLVSACAFLPQSMPPPAVEPSNNPVPDLSAYRLGVGDRLRIDVFGEPELSLDAVVDPTGRISYPLLGSIPGLQKTAGELENVIRTGLASGYLVKPDVRINVIQYRPFYIIGEIRRPGAYPFVIGLTVEKAMAIAGGLTNLASTRKVFLLREDAASEKRVRAALDTAVLPGDTVLIEQGLF